MFDVSLIPQFTAISRKSFIEYNGLPTGGCLPFSLSAAYRLKVTLLIFIRTKSGYNLSII
jgi:hypothetical protein